MDESIKNSEEPFLLIEPLELETPLETIQCSTLSGSIVRVPILRAGLGMLDSAMGMILGARVGFVGMERDESTSLASCYYNKMPEWGTPSHTFALDPMLATGGSSSQAIQQVKNEGAKVVTMVCLVAASEVIARLQSNHPDLSIVVGSIDRGLNDLNYIVPGLGDFGDRLFGT